MANSIAILVLYSIDLFFLWNTLITLSCKPSARDD